MKTISQQGIDFLKNEEGWRSAAYRDQAGYWTIGYGHKIAAHEQDLLYAEITREEGEALLRADTQAAENAVNDSITVSLHQNQFDALVSLAYNIGSGALKQSTVLQKINERAARHEIEQWWKAWNKVTIGGSKQVSKGLSARREREMALFFSVHGAFFSSATDGR